MGKDVKMQSEKFALNLSYFGELPLAIAVDVRQKVQFANSKHFANPKLVSENAQRDVQDGGRIPLISDAWSLVDKLSVNRSDERHFPD